MPIHKFAGWEDAPEGTTHFCTQQCSSPWLRKDGDKEQFYLQGEWITYNHTPNRHFEGAIERLDIARQHLENAQQRPIEEKVMFKKGDKVKVICDHPIGGWGPHVKKGDVGEVSRVMANGTMYANFPNHHNWVGYLKEFELVAPDPEVPAKKVYTLADLKGTGVDSQLKACAVDARTLRKLRDRVVYNLNSMDKFWKGDDEKVRLDNINSTFRWVESPEGELFWLGVFNKRPVKFEDIPARPRAKKAQVEQAPAIPAQPHVVVPAMVRPDPVVVKAAEAPAPKKKVETTKKKVGWW